MDAVSIHLFVEHSRPAVVSLHLADVEIMVIVRRILLREMPEDVGHVGVDVRREAQLEVFAILESDAVGQKKAKTSDPVLQLCSDGRP